METASLSTETGGSQGGDRMELERVVPKPVKLTAKLMAGKIDNGQKVAWFRIAKNGKPCPLKLPEGASIIGLDNSPVFYFRVQVLLVIHWTEPIQHVFVAQKQGGAWTLYLQAEGKNGD